jgi:branched-chain amino acid transport system substrate-binding protein
MTDHEKNSNLLDSPLPRRRFLLGVGGAAVAGGLGMLNVPEAFAAPAADFSPWFGSGGPAGGAGLSWTHGLNLSMTGQGADIGRAMSQGAQLAAEIISASGGPKMTIALNDHQSGLVPPSVQGVRRLISQQGINSIASSYGAATEALFPITREAGVTLFWSGGPSPSGLNHPNVFITIALWALDSTPGGIAFMARQFPGSKRLAILGVTENGLPAVNELAPKAWAASTGGQVVYKEFVNAGSTDFSASIGKIRAAQPDVVFTTLYGNDAGFFVKQVREGGIKAPILLIDLSPSVSQIAGAALADKCFLATDGYLASNPNPYNRAFVRAYKAKHSVDPGYFEANFFEGTMIVWAAMQRVIKAGGKPGRGPALAQAIENEPTFPSLYGGSPDKAGELTFNKDHSVTKPMGVFQIGSGGTLTKVASISKGSTDVTTA